MTFGSKSGGTNLKDDIMRIYEKIHLVVTNPGRILDSMGKKVTNVENCNILCLNEDLVTDRGAETYDYNLPYESDPKMSNIGQNDKNEVASAFAADCLQF